MPRQTRRQDFLVQVLVASKYETDDTTIPVGIGLPDFDDLTGDQIFRELFGLLVIGLAFFWAVDSCKANFYLLAVLEDLNGVTIGDANDLAFPEVGIKEGGWGD